MNRKNGENNIVLGQDSEYIVTYEIFQSMEYSKVFPVFSG